MTHIHIFSCNRQWNYNRRWNYKLDANNPTGIYVWSDDRAG